jgi:hypothetical protein
MKKRIALAAALGLASIAIGAPAQAATTGPRPLSDWVRAVQTDTGTWVDVHWTTDVKICNAKVTLSGDKLDVIYPNNTATFSSFSAGSTLKAKRTDYTAFNVTTSVDANEVVPFAAKLKYDTCGKNAEEKSKSFDLNLPVYKKLG